MERGLSISPQLELIESQLPADKLDAVVVRQSSGGAPPTTLRLGSDEMTTPAAEHPLPIATASPEPRNLAVWLLSGVIAMSAGVLFSFVASLDAPIGAPLEISVLVLALLFAVSEMAVIHIPVRRDAHTISLAEIPLVFGLALASPLALVFGRLFGSFAALAFYRRQPPIKLAFNFALFNLETAVVILIYRGALGSASPNSIFGWLVGLGAVAVGVLVSAALVDAVIAIHGGRRKFTELVRAFASASLISLSVAFLGMLSVSLIWHNTDAVVLLVGLICLFYLLLSVYGSLSKRHDDLRAVHSFTAKITGAGSALDIAATALDECRQVLRAELAHLVLVDPDSGTPRRLAVNGEGHFTSEKLDRAAFAPVRSFLEQNNVPVAFGQRHGQEIAGYFAGLDFASGMVVPIESGDRLIGVIAVGNRVGPEKSFGPHDVELLNTLGRQVALTLERAEMVERLRAEIAEKQQLIRSKDELIAAVSHELRTPLTSVLGFAELLADEDFGPDVATRSEMVRSIASEAFDLGNIVEDLLVAAREELGALTIQATPIRLDAEVKSIVDAGHIAWNHDIELQFTGVAVVSDPQRIRQVVRNLVENASRYGGDHIRIDVIASHDGAHVLVCDDGPGVPRGKDEAVFAPYQSAHAPGTQPASVGIGLTLSRGLARRMGGELSYRREDGWTVFDLMLPWDKTDEVDGKMRDAG